MAKVVVFSSDSRTETEAIGLMLEFGGHHCTPAHSVEEALNFANNDSYDVIVTHLEWERDAVKKAVQLLKAAFPRVVALVPPDLCDSAAAADAVLAIPCAYERLLNCLKRSRNRSAGPRKQAQSTGTMLPRRSRKNLRTAS